MTRQAIIEKTIKILKNLPEEKASEVSDFADFLMKKFEEEQLSKNIQKITSESESFNFLNEDQELYSTKDLKEKYND